MQTKGTISTGSALVMWDYYLTVQDKPREKRHQLKEYWWICLFVFRCRSHLQKTEKKKSNVSRIQRQQQCSNNGGKKKPVWTKCKRSFHPLFPSLGLLFQHTPGWEVILDFETHTVQTVMHTFRQFTAPHSTRLWRADAESNSQHKRFGKTTI